MKAILSELLAEGLMWKRGVHLPLACVCEMNMSFEWEKRQYHPNCGKIRLFDITKILQYLEVREGVGGFSKSRLGNNTSEGKHGKTSILEFTKLHAVNLLLALALKEIEWVKLVVSCLTVTLSLCNLNEDGSCTEFDECSSEKHESHGSLANKDIVCLVGGWYTGKRVNFTRETERESKTTISGNPSEPGHHANTSVFELSLTHPVKGRDSL